MNTKEKNIRYDANEDAILVPFYAPDEMVYRISREMISDKAVIEELIVDLSSQPWLTEDEVSLIHRIALTVSYDR